MGKEPGARAGTPPVDAWKNQPEKLPELAPNQSIFYLVRDKGRYSVETGIYIGTFRDFHSDTERAALTIQPVHNPADFMRARQEQEARRAGHGVVPGQEPIVLDKHDVQILEHSGSARLPDTRRMNPSRADVTAGVQKMTQDTERAVSVGKVVLGSKLSLEELQRATRDLTAGKMTPEAYAVVVDLARASIQYAVEDKELLTKIPRDTSHGWPFAVEALRVMEAKIESMNAQIAAYLVELKSKKTALEGRQSEAARAVTFADQLELQSLYGGIERIEQNRDQMTSSLRSGRDTIARTLGKLLTAATWYQETNPVK